MKTKLIFLALFIVTCTTKLKSGNLELDPDTEKQYWRFLKERLFDGENPYASKFQKNIYIHLSTESKDDSVIVKGLLEELRILIPNIKFDYCNDLDNMYNREICYREDVINLGVNKTVITTNSYIRRSNNINGNQIFYEGDKGIYIYTQWINLQLNDTVTFSERKRYIYYGVLRAMCTIKGNPQEARIFFENSIFNSFEYEPANSEFSEVDKFLLQKLYAEDFYEQFKKYLIEDESGRYYRAFLFRDQYESIKTLSAVLIILLILAFTYKPIIFRNYKRKISGYIAIALLTGITAFVIKFTRHNIASIYGNTVWDFLFRHAVFLIPFVIGAIILYLLENYLIKPNMPFNKRMVLKHTCPNI